MTKIITPSALFSSTSLHSSFLFHESGLDNQLEGRIYSKFSKMVFFVIFSAISIAVAFHLGIDATVPWSVCLSVTFMHCAQMAEDIGTISFPYDGPMSLPYGVKIWLTSVYPFLPTYCFNPPLKLEGKLRPNG